MNIKNRSISFACNFENYKVEYENNLLNYTKSKINEQILDFILIDDDEHDAAQTLHLFEKMPLQNKIHLFQDTRDAMRYFEAHNAFLHGPVNSIILLDQNMPETSGIEFLEELRRSPAVSNVPVFLLTHLADESLILEACHQYAQGYFVKPLNVSEFTTQISSLPGYGFKALPEGIQFVKDI